MRERQIREAHQADYNRPKRKRESEQKNAGIISLLLVAGKKERLKSEPSVCTGDCAEKREKERERTKHRHCEDRLILTYASQVIAILIKSG